MKHQINKMVEKLQVFVAWKTPRWLVYWCSVRLLANATTGKNSHVVVPELTGVSALKSWS